jgi:ABC-type sugar transport system permease subunit
MNVLTTSTPPETTFVMMRALFLAISQGRIGYGLGLVWMLLAAVILFTILLLRLGKARVPSNARPVYSAP